MTYIEPPFVLNCSRIPPYGGLKMFSCALMRAVQNLGLPCHAVVPAGFEPPKGVDAIEMPAALAGASDLSLIRPLKWLVYTRFQFPVSKRERVLCTTHHVLPGRDRQIVTVHDIRPYFFPDTPVQGFYFRHMLPRLLHRCDGVLTVSETSRQMIADVYRISLDRIAVVPNVVEIPTIQEITVESGTGDRQPPYLLMVGASWPQKNVESVLKQHMLWAGRYQLVVVAGQGQYRAQMEEMARVLGIAERVRFVDGLSSSALDHLYRNCAALVSPARMEGFGLPVVEAMARGRPVIGADLPVFHELYRNHIIYVQTDNARSWEAAFAALPAVSQERLERAREHSMMFDDARMAACLKDALNKLWDLRIESYSP